MTAPTDTFIDNFVGGAQRTQEAVTSALTDAVRTWTDTFSGIAGGQPTLPDAQIVVDRWFEVAQTVLDTQKAFAKTVVWCGHPGRRGRHRAGHQGRRDRDGADRDRRRPGHQGRQGRGRHGGGSMNDESEPRMPRRDPRTPRGASSTRTCTCSTARCSTATARPSRPSTTSSWTASSSARGSSPDRPRRRSRRSSPVPSCRCGSSAGTPRPRGASPSPGISSPRSARPCGSESAPTPSTRPWVERWVSRHIIGRIPGGRHDPG